jgi:uncharacterized protein
VSLHSPETGRTYQLWVEPPGRYDRSGDHRYPVVLCLDAPWTFGVACDAFRLLPLSGELPEAIVVGVAHDGPDLSAVIQERAKDFTPTAADAPRGTGVRVPAAELGRAADFRAFLASTVLPLVEGRYRTDGDRTLVGHSFSGLFGLTWLLGEPTAFDRWVLASPSVWWDDRHVFAVEAAQADSGEDLPARVFLSASEGDELGADGPFGGHAAFHAQLAGRQRPGLRCTWASFAGETHQSVVAPALVRGLREVFRP